MIVSLICTQSTKPVRPHFFFYFFFFDGVPRTPWRSVSVSMIGGRQSTRTPAFHVSGVWAERKSERSENRVSECGAVSGVIETDMSGERIFRRSCSAHMLCPHVVYCWQIALHIALIPSASWYTGVGLLEFRLLLSSVAHCYSWLSWRPYLENLGLPCHGNCCMLMTWQW